MKKVLIIGTTYIFGGVGRIIFDLCKHIDRDKVEFDFLYYSDASIEEKKVIKELGGNFYLVPRYSRNPIHFLKYIKKFYREHNYDWIHIHASTAMLLIYSLPVWKEENTKIIYHSHASYLDGGFNRILHRLLKPLVIKHSDIRLAVSKQAATLMYGEGLNYICLNNGIDTAKYCYDPKVRSNIRSQVGIEDKYVIGNVGRFSVVKNHKFMLKVFNKIYNKDNNTVLLLVGGGELEDEIRQEVKERKLEDSVIFYGTTNEVSKIFQVMDVFFLPSLWEAFPVAAIEAQAAGLPVVASTEISDEVAITPDFHNMDLNRDSIDVWADKLLSLKDSYNRTNKYEAIIQAGYDITTSADELKNIYIGDLA